MEIVQKKGANVLTFTFHDDHVTFSYVDKSGSGEADIAYPDIPLKPSIQIEQNQWLRNVGYLWCALGVVQLGLALASKSPLSGKGFWLLMGIGCLIWAHFSKVKYSVFKARTGNLFVIQDGKHDGIVNELKSRRKHALLRQFGSVGSEGNLDAETRKFKWLFEQQALDQQELESKLMQAKLVFSAQTTKPFDSLS